MQCVAEHMREFRSLEECVHTNEVHMSLEEMRLAEERSEVQSQKDFLKFSRAEPIPMRLDQSNREERAQYKEAKKLKIVRKTYVMLPDEEMKVGRLLNKAESDWDSVSVGTARYEPKALGDPVKLRKGVMPVADGRGVRLSCSKWDRYAPVKSVRTRSNECDPAALAEALREMGL